ncbi:MAG TPA: pantoate--beta-alanine ligase [Acidimicrobiales bacterium]|jgi:pantoate--beta-alanine ligase|nr:pantoate--beta-alanine ligase [Acidimicrobiales bacterium]
MSTASILAPTGPDGVLDDRLTLVHTVAEFGARLEAARAAGRTVGLVPTMGALHDGHRSLVQRAAAECDLVAVTVFVNPLQFGNPDDLDHYPRTLEADSAVVAGAGGQLLFAPALTEMYPDFPAPVRTSVGVVGVSEAWEGASRPGHFDGVSTVVSKLFAMAGRCRAYFGEKDFQQLAVVRTMARDLSFPVEVVGCSTVRDPDGLALSSRNVRLAPEERRAALVLHRALRAGAAAVSAGQLDVPAIEADMARLVAEEPLVDLDYAVLVDAGDLTRSTVTGTDRPQRLLIAAQVGPVRLIDNLDPRQAVPSPQFRVTKGTN